MDTKYRITRVKHADSRPGRFYCNLSVVGPGATYVKTWGRLLVTSECATGDGSAYDVAMTEAEALCAERNGSTDAK